MKVFNYFFLLFILSPFTVFSSERILSFKANININEDSSFQVTEIIEYDFGKNSKRGIFRDIPLYHSRKISTRFGEVSSRYGIRLEVLAVSYKNNKKIKYKLIYKPQGIRIRIGDPSVHVSGVKTYVIKYEVKRAINRFKAKDEFYWNVTGNYWKVPIHEASVKVVWPKGISIIDSVNYKGFLGSKLSIDDKVDQGSNFYSVKAMDFNSGEGLTVGLSFNKGVLKEPSSLQKFIWFLIDNITYIIFFPIPLVTFIFFYFLHKRKGMDPYHPGVLQVRYEPPSELNPAEVGTLEDEVVDTSDIVATVLDMASRGYLKIKEIKSNKWLFLSDTDYEFVKTKKNLSSADVSIFESTFMSCLFSGKESVLLSSLKEKFYVHLSPLKQDIYDSLIKKNIFDEDPSSVRNKYMFSSMILIGLVHVLIFSYFQSTLSEFFIFPIIVSVFLSFLVAKKYSDKMPRKTKKGVKNYYEILGFKEFLTRVEKPKIKVMMNENPEIFGRMLPYAVVLGCADDWAEKFEGLITEPLSWYEGQYVNGVNHFSSRAFVNSMGQSINTMANTFKSAPQPSGGAGGGGGFSSGGGGFSGGGFGGGGGGSW